MAIMTTGTAIAACSPAVRCDPLALGFDVEVVVGDGAPVSTAIVATEGDAVSVITRG